MSTNPGATIFPSASMVRVAWSSSSPIAAMRPSLMPTSARRPGAPVPSTTVPPRMIVSSMAPLLSSADAECTRGPGCRRHGCARGIGAAIARRFASRRRAGRDRCPQPRTGLGWSPRGIAARGRRRHRRRRRVGAPDRRRSLGSELRSRPRSSPRPKRPRPGRHPREQRRRVLLPLDRRDVGAAPARRVRSQRRSRRTSSTKAVVPGMRERGAGWIVEHHERDRRHRPARLAAAGAVVDVRAEQGRARPADRSRSPPSCAVPASR